MTDFNSNVIEEFRANEGKIGGFFAGTDMLLLTTVDAKTGEPKLTPIIYVEDAGRIFIVGSKGGSPSHPDWYHNMIEQPDVTVEIGSERYQARARILAEPERAQRFAWLAERVPGYGEYQEKTTRVIPVVELVRVRENDQAIRSGT